MTLRQSILSTLAYHDIFDYPLKLEEIYKYLIQKKTNLKTVTQTTSRLVKEDKAGEKNGHYFLKKRQSIVKLRKDRFKYSQLKLKKAQFFAALLNLVPTIKLVAASGALAMANSHKYDDIDFVIITQKDTLWTTRFLSNLILFPFKRKPSRLQTTRYKLPASPVRFDSTRRAKRGEPTNNKACLNIFIDESNLRISPQNLYTAHEICQLKLLWDREKTYSKFIEANRWVKKFLPNWQPSVTYHASSIKGKNLSRIAYRLSLAENFMRSFQLWYMRPKITTEKIGEKQLFFHPSKLQESVLKEYKQRLKKLKFYSA